MIALVDKQGEIVFIGHPRQRKNLEQDIDNLLNGKELETYEQGAPQGQGQWS